MLIGLGEDDWRGVGYVGKAGFMLTSNFQYFTTYDQQMPEAKSAIGFTYRLLFCLTGS